MRTLRARGPAADHSRRGAALMLSMLVLLVLVAVVFQLNVATSTDARVARNDVALTAMDLAAESALLMTFDQLVRDAEAQSEAGGPAGGAGGGGGLGGGLGGGGLGGGGFPGAGGEGVAGQEGPVDSREDEWAKVESTEIIEGLRMRVLVRDENSKYNVLSMLDPDPARAEQALRRVARIIDLYREGTDEDIDAGRAEDMAERMLDHLTLQTELARPRLSTDDEEARVETKPLLSLRELIAYPEFESHHFQDYRAEDDVVVHSLTAYLTAWSSLQTRAQWEEARQAQPGGEGVAGGGQGGQGAPGGQNAQGGAAGQGGQGGAGGAGGGGLGGGAGAGGGQIGAGGGAGGGGISGQAGMGNAEGAQSMGGGGAGAGGASDTGGKVNLNTAPPVVLKALMDESDVDPRFWDEVVVYRNEEDETQVDEDAEPTYDEFGEEVVPQQVFASTDTLMEMTDWDRIEPEAREQLFGLVGVTSDVFTIYVTVQRNTARDADLGLGSTMTRAEYEQQLFSPTNLTRTVACTVWRRNGEEGVELVPLQRWEYLDYIPYEVLDFPDEDR